VFRAASRGLLPILGEGEHVYNFVYAADLADAFVVAARHPATEGRTFFVHHPARVEMRAFLRQVAAAVERRARWLAIPDSALRVAAAVSEILGQVTPRPPLLGRQRLLELAGAAYVTSPAAFERETGWRAAVDLAEGTRRTARWYREHGWLPRRGGPRVDDSRPQVENPPEGGT
jgi:nucleoside-diphosphate-sugar epimerase